MEIEVSVSEASRQYTTMIGAAKFELDDAKRPRVIGSVRGEARRTTAVRALQQANGVAGTIGSKPGIRHTPKRASILPRGSPPSLFDDRWRVVAALKSSVAASAPPNSESADQQAKLLPARSSAVDDGQGELQQVPSEDGLPGRSRGSMPNPHRQESAADPVLNKAAAVSAPYQQQRRQLQCRLSPPPARIGASRQAAGDRGESRPLRAAKTAIPPEAMANVPPSSMTDRGNASRARPHQKPPAASTARAPGSARRAPPQQHHDAKASRPVSVAGFQHRDAVAMAGPESNATLVASPPALRAASSVGKQHVVTDFPYVTTPSKQHIVSFAGSGANVGDGVYFAPSRSGLEAHKFVTAVDQLRLSSPSRLPAPAVSTGIQNGDDDDGRNHDGMYDHDDGEDYESGGVCGVGDGGGSGKRSGRRSVSRLMHVPSRSMHVPRARSYSPAKRPPAAARVASRQSVSSFSVGRARSSSPKKSSGRRWRADNRAASSYSKSTGQQPPSWMFMSAQQSPTERGRGKGSAPVDGAVVDAVVFALRQAGVASPVLTRQIAAAVKSRISPVGRGKQPLPPMGAGPRGGGGFGPWDGDSALAPQADVLPDSKLAPAR